MTISTQHLRRGGLARHAHSPKSVTRGGKIICRDCDTPKHAWEYYHNSRHDCIQQPCKKCKLAKDKANYDKGRNPYSPREVALSPDNPSYAPRGDKQVKCPFPACGWRGPVTALNEHRKEHQK